MSERIIRELSERETAVLAKACRRVARELVVYRQLSQEASRARQRAAEAEEAANDLMEILLDGGAPKGLRFDEERSALVAPAEPTLPGNGGRPEVSGALEEEEAG